MNIIIIVCASAYVTDHDMHAPTVGACMISYILC